MTVIMSSLSPKEVAVFRSLNRIANVLLLIFRLDKPVGRNEIAQILAIDPETASKYLKSLSKLGLISRTDYRNGYILTTGGRQLVLGQTPKDLALKALSPVNPGTKVAADDALKALPTEAQSPVNPGTQAVADSALQVLSQDEALVLEPGDPESGNSIPKVEIFPLRDGLKMENFPFQNSLKVENRYRRGKFDPEKGNFPSSEEEEEESINLINPTSSSFLPKKEKFNPQKLPSMSVLLGASDLLFGRLVTDFGLPDRPPAMVLGWLAHAYNERAGLRSPAGVAYRGIEEGRLPRAQYLERPEEFLPADYLQAIGLGQLVPQDESPEIDADPDPEDDQVDNPIVEDPSIDQPVGKFTPRRAWQAVLSQLQTEMPKATYDSWVSDTWPVRFESQGIMVVGAPNAYARDWLAGRLTSTVTRLLTGLFNRTVEVQFENYE